MHILRKTLQLCGLAHTITKTCLYNFDPLKPHFYIVKLGFTGVYIIFLISAQKHRLWVLVRTAPPRRFWRVPTIYFLSRNTKNIRVFYLKNCRFLEVNVSIYLNRRVFIMPWWINLLYLGLLSVWVLIIRILVHFRKNALPIHFESDGSWASKKTSWTRSQVWPRTKCLPQLWPGTRCPIDTLGEVCHAWSNVRQIDPLCNNGTYSRISMDRISLGPWKCVRDMGCSSHWGYS